MAPAVTAALVTGAARGIGRRLALELASLGYDVAVHFNASRDDAARTAREVEGHGVRSLVLQADLTDAEAATELVRAADRALGDLGILVNNVGNYVIRPLDELTHEEWRDMFATNLDATFTTCQAAIPLMRARGGGAIVNLGFAGSTNLVARPSTAAYSIAKTGVVLLSRAIAKAEAGAGITCNVIAPGVIETSRSKPLREIPMDRLGTVDEVAAALRYLVSEDASYVTGQVIEVAGAWNL